MKIHIIDYGMGLNSVKMAVRHLGFEAKSVPHLKHSRKLINYLPGVRALVKQWKN